MLSSFNSVSRKTMQRICSGSVSKQMKGTKPVRKSVALQRADQPWPIWSLSLIKWLAAWTRGDQGVWYPALSDSTHQSHQSYHCKNFSCNAYKLTSTSPQLQRRLWLLQPSKIICFSFLMLWSSSFRFACFSCFVSWDTHSWEFCRAA